ncbi:MAG: hypothetical protein ACW97G_10025 [Candidatus Thorarchaeota archaeon]|jgi:hypothetical protein
MVKICDSCGSTDTVQFVYNSFSDGGDWRCNTCLNQRFPEGSRIVKFTDTSHPHRPAYYLCIESQDDLDLIMTVGERAHTIGAKGIEACFYTAFRRGRRIGPNAFTLGHDGSVAQLRSHVDTLRMFLDASKKLVIED